MARLLQKESALTRVPPFQLECIEVNVIVVGAQKFVLLIDHFVD